jgi:iron(III) transport system permease protein
MLDRGAQMSLSRAEAVSAAAPVRAWRPTAAGVVAALPVAIALFFTLPIAAILLHLLLPAEGAAAHLATTVLPGYALTTLQLALGTGIGVTVLGTATAWLVTLCRFPGRGVFAWALVLPLAVPGYVMAYAYTDMLQFAGPVQTALRAAFGWEAGEYWFPQIRSVGGATAMLVLVLYPYVYLLARTAFLEQSVCTLEVARTLGCTPWASFRRVALPAARPAIVAGTALALMEAMADYGTVAFFGVQTFTTGIVRAWLSYGDRVAAAQLSAVLLSIVLAVVLLERHSRAQARFHHTSARYRFLPADRLRGARAAAAWLACAMPVALGFLLPMGVLAGMALGVDEPGRFGRYAELVRNSFVLGGTTAALAVATAIVMAYGARLKPTPLTLTANRMASLGYAVPGAVMAVGVLIPSAAADNALDGWMRATFGVSTGLLLTGSIAALIYAYLVRFLAVSFTAVEASLGKINPNMDAAARVLGCGPLAAVRRVHLPLMRPSLLAAALLVFVDVVKELPATLMMRPFNFDTLAVQAYNFAADERLAEAAIPSLIIVGIGLVPVILLSRTIARSRPGTPAQALP